MIVASVFKFPRRSVGGKYLMRIQSETFVFKFFRREVDGAQEVEIALSMMFWQYLNEKNHCLKIPRIRTGKLILHFEFLLIKMDRDNMKTFTNQTIKRFLILNQCYCR